MGYKCTEKKEGQDLVYEGEVKIVTVLETATDLLVMHEEIGLLQHMVQHLIKEKRDAGIQLELLVALQHNSKSYEEAWANVMRLTVLDGSENQTYAHLPLKAEQFHAPQYSNLGHEGTQPYMNLLPNTGSPQMCWDDSRVSNPTHYQNYPEKENENVTLQIRTDRNPASTSQDDQQSLNETNDSINPDTLPPPIMNFSMTPHSEVLESGLVMSGIVGARDGLTLLPPSESGPLGLQITESDDHSPNLTYDHSITTSSSESVDLYGSGPVIPAYIYHSITKSSSSSESVDLYGSGPVIPAHKYQRSSFSSVPPLPEEAGIERGWVMIGKDGQNDVPSSPSTQKSPQPAIVTEGSKDTKPRELDSEVKPTPKPRDMLRDKTQSVDVAEDQKRGEKVHPVMRPSKSGSNLLDSQHIPDQSNSTNLDKPTPRPRSRSPSPAASSNENSPSASPTPPYRNIPILPGNPPGQRPTHEMWSPTGAPKQLKSSTLPHQTQSVDRESEGKREMTHFSSGSKIRGEGLHLPLKTSTAQNTIEPDTQVKGIIPPMLRRVHVQNSNTHGGESAHALTKTIDQEEPTIRSRVNAPSGLRPGSVVKKELVTKDAVKDDIADKKSLDDSTTETSI